MSEGAGDDDDLLLRHTCEGDESAFVSLYRRHREPLYRFSLRMLGDANRMGIGRMDSNCGRSAAINSLTSTS
jgi:hypothetical protein